MCRLYHNNLIPIISNYCSDIQITHYNSISHAMYKCSPIVTNIRANVIKLCSVTNLSRPGTYKKTPVRMPTKAVVECSEVDISVVVKLNNDGQTSASVLDMFYPITFIIIQ